MHNEVVGDKGKGKGKNGSKEKGGEAMWAVMMVKELWKKGVWADAKTVSIVSLAVFHPNTKVQAAAIHFFLGSENDEEAEEEEEDEVREARKDVKKMQHSLDVGKSGRKKEKLLKLSKREANKVSPVFDDFSARADIVETLQEASWSRRTTQLPRSRVVARPPNVWRKALRQPAQTRQDLLARPQDSHHAATISGHGRSQALHPRLLQLHHQVSLRPSTR